MKKLVVGMISSLVMFSAASHATEICSNLPGTWEGAGLVRFDLDPAKNVFCVYRGTSKVTSPDPSATTFTSDVTLALLSGPCPATVTWSILGVCNNSDGSIVMNSTDGSTHLTGKLLNGHTGTLGGTATFEVNGVQVEGTLDKTLLFKLK